MYSVTGYVDLDGTGNLTQWDSVVQTINVEYTDEQKAAYASSMGQKAFAMYYSGKTIPVMTLDGGYTQDEQNEAVEEANNVRNWSNETVEPVEPGTPVAIAGGAVTVKSGETVQFNGAGTDDDGVIVLYEWDFNNDGVFEWSSRENGRITNIYNKEGTYTAVLRVTDDDGRTATDSRVITVGDGGGGGDDSDDGFLPAPSLAASVAAVAVIALRRRR